MPTSKRSKAKKTKSRRRFDLSFRPAYPRTRKSAFEIARIGLSSASRDAIILSAHRDDTGRFRYRMVHEDAFGRTRHRIRVKPPSSAQPLTLGEIIAMLEHACYAGPCPDEGDDERYGGVIWGTLQLTLDHGVDHADDYLFFLRITSSLYPQLERYYLDRVSDWCLANCIEDDDCRRIVRLRTGRFPRRVVSMSE